MSIILPFVFLIWAIYYAFTNKQLSSNDCSVMVLCAISIIYLHNNRLNVLEKCIKELAKRNTSTEVQKAVDIKAK